MLFQNAGVSTSRKALASSSPDKRVFGVEGFIWWANRLVDAVLGTNRPYLSVFVR